MLIYQFTVYPHTEEWKQYLMKPNLGEWRSFESFYETHKYFRTPSLYLSPLHGARGILLRWLAHLVLHCTDEAQLGRMQLHSCMAPIFEVSSSSFTKINVIRSYITFFSFPLHF